MVNVKRQYVKLYNAVRPHLMSHASFTQQFFFFIFPVFHFFINVTFIVNARILLTYEKSSTYVIIILYLVHNN